MASTHSKTISDSNVVWRFYGRIVEKISAAPRRAALILLLCMVPATVLTVQFFSNVQAGLIDLLPKDAPSVLALTKLHAQLGGKSQLMVIVQSPDGEVNRRFISTLAGRVRDRHLPEVRSILADIRVERQWAQDHAALLLSKDKFDPLIDELDDAIDRAKAEANPFYVDMEEREPAEKGWNKLEKKLDSESRTFDRFPRGFLEMPDGKTVVMMIALQGSEVDLDPSANLLSAVRHEATALKAEFPADLRVAYSGEVANLVEEHDAILADLSLSSVLVFLLVGILISAYFRSVRGVVAVFTTLAPGLLFTFALGRLIVGHLNSNTAFLGSIIAGNGINYPLLLLAYYRTRSPVGVGAQTGDPAGGQRCAIRAPWAPRPLRRRPMRGLAVSTFKGFSQFGLIGGVGMLTTWVLTLHHHADCHLVCSIRRARVRSATSTQVWLLRFYRRRVPALHAIAGAVLANYAHRRRVRRAPRPASAGLYEMNLLTLRNRESLRSGSGSWDNKMSELFGVWLNPVAAIVPEPATREVSGRRAATGADPGGATGRRARRDHGRLPANGGRAAAAPRAACATSRRVAAEGPARPDSAASARPYLDAWLAPQNLQRHHRRPMCLRRSSDGFSEVDGHNDRVILVYPSLKINYNDGRNIIKFADQLSTAKLPHGTVVGGAFLFMAEIIRLVRDEAPRVVMFVCLLVALALLPIFSRQPAAHPAGGHHRWRVSPSRPRR